MQIMQAAYGVLDRFKISRAFFVKTNQADCNVLPTPAADPIAKSAEIDIVAKNAVPDVVEKVEHAVEVKEVSWGFFSNYFPLWSIWIYIGYILCLSDLASEIRLALRIGEVFTQNTILLSMTYSDLLQRNSNFYLSFLFDDEIA